MIARQRRWSWIAMGLLTAATLGLAARPVAAQGYSGSSGGGFGGSSGGGFGGSSGGGFGGSSGGLGSSGGSGFTGSSGGLGFSGSGSSMGFTGSSSSSGFGGTTTTPSRGSGYGGSGTNQVVPQASDPFQSYYANPYKFGVTSTTGTGLSSGSGQFGAPLYGTINTPKTTTSTTGAGTSSGGMSFNTVGMRRAPSYQTTLAFAPPVVAPPSVLQTRLSTSFQSSSQITSNSNIQIVVDGATVILRGRVANENERRLAEGMVRLEPGVRNVRNELTIGAARAAGTP